MKKFTLAAVAALAVSAMPAFAADMPAKAASGRCAPPPPAWDLAFGSAIASDYVWRGITQSNHKPSVAAYFEPRYNINKDLQLYAGIGGASISFPNRAAAEIDFYAGFRPTFGKFAFDFGAWYYWYPGGQCFNAAVPSDGCSANGSLPINGNVAKADVELLRNLRQGELRRHRRLRPRRVRLLFAERAQHRCRWHLLRRQRQVHLRRVRPRHHAVHLRRSRLLGSRHQRLVLRYRGPGTTFAAGIPYASYTTWSLGIGWTWKVFTLDLRYTDTDLSKGDCNAFTSDNTAHADRLRDQHQSGRLRLQLVRRALHGPPVGRPHGQHQPEVKPLQVSFLHGRRPQGRRP